jgi:preprotein translocase subunit SecE
MKKYLNQAIVFLTEAKVEIKKVSWPSRQEVKGGTIAVIIAVAIIAFFLGVVDIGLSELIKILI